MTDTGTRPDAGAGLAESGASSFPLPPATWTLPVAPAPAAPQPAPVTVIESTVVETIAAPEPEPEQPAAEKVVAPIERLRTVERRPRLVEHDSDPTSVAVAAAMERALATPSSPTVQGMVLMPMNRVYDHLVEGEDDVIGLIAYSLYKQDKRAWTMGWKSQRGAEPTADQMQAFVNAQMTMAQRERYRAAARQVLDSYAMVAVEAERPAIMQQAIAGRVELAAERARKANRWWKQIPAAIIGAIVAAAIIIGVIAALRAFDVDVGGYLGVRPADTTAADGANGVL